VKSSRKLSKNAQNASFYVTLTQSGCHTLLSSLVSLNCEKSASKNKTFLITNFKNPRDTSLPEIKTNVKMFPSRHSRYGQDIAQDLEKLFNTENFSDVKIVCGNETFFCHKNILAARSNVFAVMFDKTDSTENQTGVVQVDYLDANTMKSLLSFIYGDKIDNKKDLLSAVSTFSSKNKQFVEERR
jgi:hypothetical protein